MACFWKMFLSKNLLMCILLHGSISVPKFFKFFAPIKIEDSQIPVSSVAHPEADQQTAELFQTETKSSAFFKPIKIGSSMKQFQTETDSSSFLTPIKIGPSKKQASFQVPVINQLMQNKIKGGPRRLTEQPTSQPKEPDSLSPQELDSLLPQEPNFVSSPGTSFFSPKKSDSFLPQESRSVLPKKSNSFLPQEADSFLPQELNILLPPGSNSFVHKESNSFLPRGSNTFLVKSTTTPAPDASKSIVQGFRVIGDPSNTVVFLDLKALRESGIDISSPTIHIGSDALEIIEGPSTEAPTNPKLAIPAPANQKLTKPASANQRLTIPAPAFVTKATATPPKSVIQSLKPSRLPESIKKFSVSLKSDKAPVFFSRKVSTSPSLSSQDFSNIPVTSAFSSSTLGTQGFSNFPVKSGSSASSLGFLDFSNFPANSVSQAVPRPPLLEVSSNVNSVDPDAGTSYAFDSSVDVDPLVQLESLKKFKVSGSHHLLPLQQNTLHPLDQPESLKKFKVPGSLSTSSTSAHLSEEAQSSFSTRNKPVHNHLLSLQQEHQQQLQQHRQQLQQVHQQEQDSILGKHEDLTSVEKTLQPLWQQHDGARHPQQPQQVQQESLHGEHHHLSSEIETSDEAHHLLPLQQETELNLQHQQQLQQHQEQLLQHQQQLLQVGDPQQLQQVLKDSRHGEHHHLSSEIETVNDAHHLLPVQQQHELHPQHQQQLLQHQQQLQQHHQQVEELKQQLQLLEQHRQTQLEQLEQQEKFVHRFSQLQEEEDALHTTYHENLKEAFQLLG